MGLVFCNFGWYRIFEKNEIRQSKKLTALLFPVNVDKHEKNNCPLVLPATDKLPSRD